MTTPIEHRLSEPIGPGRTVIEASAGTGKTYAISAIVAGLVAGEGVSLEEILVVTFTRAATAELRSRVRSRLRDTLRAIEDPTTAEGDDRLAFLAGGTDRSLAAARLEEALTHFDRAQIFTIDGFARRLLGQLGLRARLPVDVESSPVDDLVLLQTASDLVIGRFTAEATDVVSPGDVAAIGKKVIETADARIVPDAGVLSGEPLARVELAHAMRREVRRRMRMAGVAAFDDTLEEVRDALADPEVGPSARALLQRRYTVALVDESQDTDPIQWQVIRSVFDDARLVVIGDPKQSIYSFRGADVESYLSAAEGANAPRTLSTNWRSDGPLIAGLDVLFAGATFGDDRIAYRDVRPAPDHGMARIHGIGASLSIRRFGDDLDIEKYKGRAGYFIVAHARSAVAADAASEIVRLLSGGVTIDGPRGPEPLRPDHIAVLCRTRRQVEMVRRELSERSVPSVAARTGGVFASSAAAEWKRLLHGVEQPDRGTLVRMAATSLLVGRSPQEVAALTEDDVLDLQQRMRRWQRILQDEGVPALVAAIDRATAMTARILTLPDGERIMTDITHIAEEMHAVWRRRRLGSLIGWLDVTMKEAMANLDENVEEPESRQRRLETDADAVQVQTIHTAKGLQWPVVLVPYAWDVPRVTLQYPTYHDPAPAPGSGARRRLIHVAGKGSPGFDEAARLARAEDAAEEGRLLYVALTRAEHHLVVWWIENHKATPESKLHQLITRDGRTADGLVGAAGGAIAMPVLDTLPTVVDYRPDVPAPSALDRARFGRRLDPHWRRASFTSLSPQHPLAAAIETSDRPLRSDEEGVDEETEEVPLPAAGPLPMADLPRGARFGTLLHHIFEVVPFDAPDLEGAMRAALDEELRSSGWDLDREAIVTGMVEAMSTPLGPDPATPRLRDLDPGRILPELSFEFPVHIAAGTVSLAAIGDLMAQYLPADDPFRSYPATLQGAADQRFRGFLTGSIDLAAALPLPGGDRYVVIDYKSNAMPASGDVAAARDYGPGPLATAMIRSNYVLQATLYQVAMHRYLRWRLRGYDPEQHLGGAMYLFVRGMTGADTPVVDGERCGVARWHPPASMIVALSDLFTGGAS